MDFKGGSSMALRVDLENIAKRHAKSKSLAPGSSGILQIGFVWYSEDHGDDHVRCFGQEPNLKKRKGVSPTGDLLHLMFNNYEIEQTELEYWGIPSPTNQNKTHMNTRLQRGHPLTFFMRRATRILTPNSLDTSG